MNFLTKTNAAVSRALIIFGITSMLALAAAAQRIEPSQQGKMYGDPGFRGEPINLNVVNADIRDILSYITDQYGINFVIDRSIKEIPVTVKVNDVPWNVALDSVLQAQGIGVQVNGSILRVATNETLASEGELYRQRSKYQLDTAPLVTEMIRLSYATAGGAAAPGKTSAGTSGMMGGGASSGGTNGGGADFGASSGGDGLLPIIRRRLSRRGSIEIDSRSNSIVVTDVAQNIAAIKQLIAILDQPEPQVEIEARIVVATRNFSRDIGVQLGSALTGGKGSGIMGGSLPQTPLGLSGTDLIPNPSVTNDLLSKISNTAIGLTTGIFGTAQLSAIISAGEQKGQAKVIATPRVTALNNRSAEIKSGSKIPVTTIQPGSVGSNLVATTTYIDVPLRLQITPQITEQGTVILNVVAENSSTAAIVGGIAPAINTQSMTTQVIVPDGGTTVIGGVLFDDERESQDRTPGLASLPILGNLFKRKGVQRNTNEILFFITPRISRPDFANQNPVVGNRGGQIIQPVPMDNPPSNSVAAPAVAAGPQLVLQAPTQTRPDGSTTGGATPDKP
jgi:type IV pilus assembly protein PilQ